MIYRAIGLHCGSYTYGFDIAQIQFHQNAGNWDFNIIHADHYPYTAQWQQKLKQVTGATIQDYLLADNELGAYLGNAVNEFINKYQLHYQVQLIAANGYATIYLPQQKISARLGNGGAISAITGIPVVSDFSSIDLALGGHGGPVIAAHQLLFNAYEYWLHAGDVVSLSVGNGGSYNGFQICTGIQLLQNLLGYRDGAATRVLIEAGNISDNFLKQLNSFNWSSASATIRVDSERLAAFSELVTEQINGMPLEDVYRTYWEYLINQIKESVAAVELQGLALQQPQKMLLTVDAGPDTAIAEMLQQALTSENVLVEVAAEPFAQFSQAVQCALCGLLRWRDEYNHEAGVTGASRSSIGGALWMGAEA